MAALGLGWATVGLGKSWTWAPQPGGTGTCCPAPGPPPSWAGLLGQPGLGAGVGTDPADGQGPLSRDFLVLNRLRQFSEQSERAGLAFSKYPTLLQSQLGTAAGLGRAQGPVTALGGVSAGWRTEEQFSAVPSQPLEPFPACSAWCGQSIWDGNTDLTAGRALGCAFQAGYMEGHGQPDLHSTEVCPALLSMQ